MTTPTATAGVPPGLTPSEIVQSYRPIDALLPASWRQGFVTANGIRHCYYRTGGDHPPLVLLHGIFEGALSWLRVAREFARDYDLILIDTRGHGHSDRATSGYSYELLVDDAAGVIQALGLQAVHLLGFSQGASTAVLVADRYPQLVRTLIVAGASEGPVQTDFTHSPSYQAWLKSYIAWLAQLKVQSHAERRLAGLSQLPPGAPVPPEDEYVPWLEDCANLDLELVRMGNALWSKLPEVVAAMSAALQRVNCPTLVLKSEFFPQPGAPESMQEEPAGRPNQRVVRFVNSGHLIHREQFAGFVTVIQGFLTANQ